MVEEVARAQGNQARREKGGTSSSRNSDRRWFLKLPS